MYHPRTAGTLYYLILGSLILLSFFTFSEQFYPLLNSDMAVNILMTPGFSIPGDLYFWGQDRAGSLLPMVAQILCSTYRFPPILAVSVVHYFFLIAGFYAIATLFKDRSLKLALAFIWFFPCWHFLDHVLLLYGIQMSMVAMAVYFVNRFTQLQTLKIQLVWLSLAWLAVITAIWVSDIAVVSLLAFLTGLWLVRRNLRSGQSIRTSLKDKNSLIFGIVSLLWLVLGLLFILYAKSKAFRVDSYNTDFFNNAAELGTTLAIMARSLFEVYTFTSENIPESIYAWMVLIGVPWILILTKTKRDPLQPFKHQRWLFFFLLNGLLTLVLVIVSHWVFINGVGRRYFTIIYISLWISFLLFLQANGSKNRSLRLGILTVIILTGAFSSINKFYFPKRVPSRVSILNELKTLGHIGIISEYWNAYLSASPDPNHIKATPHDKDYVRNLYLAEEVFRQPRIYLIKDGWLDSFPDTIQQFGHMLVKKGEMFRLAGGYLCRYLPLVLDEKYGCTVMKHQGVILQDEEASNGQSVCTGKETDKNKHFVYGPFISLSQGRYMVKFRLKSSENLSTEKIAFLDISGDYGKTILASRTIQASDFGRANAFQEFEIPVELYKQFDGIEFRILYLGTPTLYFDRVEIRGI